MAPAYAQSERIAFDIPAQPLSEAIKQYASQSQRPILIRSQLSQGVLSTAIKGDYTAHEALVALLRNTALQANLIRDAQQDIYIIEASSPAQAKPALSLQGYPGLIQQQIMQALCQTSSSLAASHRSLIQITITKNGSINPLHIISSSAPPTSLAFLEQQLLQLRFSSPPPTRLPQPITLLLESGTDNAASFCAESP